MPPISIKDYAKQKGVTYEAIRKQISRYKNELEGHIVVDHRRQLLDETAVAILDKHREGNPVIVYQQDKDEELQNLRDENNNLLKQTVALLNENKALIEKAGQIKLLLKKSSPSCIFIKASGLIRLVSPSIRIAKA